MGHADGQILRAQSVSRQKCVCVRACVPLCTTWSPGLRRRFQRNGYKSLSVLGFEKHVQAFPEEVSFHTGPHFYLPVPLHILPYHFSLAYMGSSLTGMPSHPFRTSLFKTNENKSKIPLSLFKPRHTHNLDMKRLCQEIKRRERLGGSG